MESQIIKVSLHITDYIAHPYWPERERLINIIKESGMSRARSTQNRRRALDEYLKAHSMSLAEFEALEILANRQFYVDEDNQIIIPSLHMTSMLVNICHEVRHASRPCPPEQVRAALKLSDFATGKYKADGIWERFVVVTGGHGGKISNQRALRVNEYIEDFDATGTIEIRADFVRPDTLRSALEWGGLQVGVGASRKMGRGRFTVVTWHL